MKLLSIELTHVVSRKRFVYELSFVIFIKTPLKREFVFYHQFEKL